MDYLIPKHDYEMLTLHLEQIFKLSDDFITESVNRNRDRAYFMESINYIKKHSENGIGILKEINK